MKEIYLLQKLLNINKETIIFKHIIYQLFYCNLIINDRGPLLRRTYIDHYTLKDLIHHHICAFCTRLTK